jgi:hypothetical protein
MKNDATRTVGADPALSHLKWQTVVHRDGTRTLALGGQTIGHYSRIHYKHAKGQAAGWRGVTHRGQLVYAKSERAVRDKIREVYEA